jgi:digeranylgeranylglycerophospholipid reductase
VHSSNRREADVLVVGAGPAGLLAAKTTASAGLATIVVEREPEVGYEVHTSGGMDMKTMHDFGIPRELYHPLNRLRIISPGEEIVRDGDAPIVCVIDVRGMYQHLGHKAREQGALILTNTQASEPLMKNGSVVGCRVTHAQDEESEIRARIVIDCSGYRASISKKAGLHDGFARFGLGCEYELEAPHCNQEELVLLVGNRYAPAGCAWVFPWGGTRVRVGVGILVSGVSPNAYLKTFLEDAHKFGIDISDAKVVESHFGLIPAEGLPSRLVADGIMAAGDAAGQVSLIAGAGIKLAMLAGRLAGETASRALAKGRCDSAILLRYERKFRSMYGRSLHVGHMVNLRMAHYDDREWDSKVRMLRTIPTDLLARLLQSEFPLVNILSWSIRRPQLWSKTGRYALKGLAAGFRGESGHKLP